MDVARIFMGSDNMKMRAQLKGLMTEVKVLISHPMETGRKRDRMDNLIPAHFVQLVTATLNGKTVLEAQWGTGISKNPYLTFKVSGAKIGDTITVTWHDNFGDTATQSINVT